MGLKPASIKVLDEIFARADRDDEFRQQLVSSPRATLQQECGITLPPDYELCIHAETDTVTHLVIPPQSKLSGEEREEARVGASSLEFLKKTMYDPAPPKRVMGLGYVAARLTDRSWTELTKQGKSSIDRGLEFLEKELDENGAWYCVRFNVGDSNIPRHYERPPFISAFCAQALQCSKKPRAKAIIERTQQYLVDTMEYPGFWRYYRHLPLDLDSSSLCSMMVGEHPWICFSRNVPRILANTDDEGRFMTWLLEEGEPDVVTQFRIEADPVVNANIIAYLGDCPGTKAVQNWLKRLVLEGKCEGTSKWYPDEISLYYALSHAVVRVCSPALDELKSTIADRLLSRRERQGDFGDVFKTARAISTLYNIGWLERVDTTQELALLIETQNENGSWPEVLAFGDQSLKFGIVGRIGHGAETVTTAFCIEALERLTGTVAKPTA